MLIIKVTEDVNILGKPFIHMGIKPDFEVKKNDLFRAMSFVWDRYNKQYSRTFTDKDEIKRLIAHLIKQVKDYQLEHIKVVKRVRSESLNKLTKKISGMKLNSKNLF